MEISIKANWRTEEIYVCPLLWVCKLKAKPCNSLLNSSHYEHKWLWDEGKCQKERRVMKSTSRLSQLGNSISFKSANISDHKLLVRPDQVLQNPELNKVVFNISFVREKVCYIIF